MTNFSWRELNINSIFVVFTSLTVEFYALAKMSKEYHVDLCYLHEKKKQTLGLRYAFLVSVPKLFSHPLVFGVGISF